MEAGCLLSPAILSPAMLLERRGSGILDRGGAGLGGPRVAGEVGEDEEGFPDVGGAVVLEVGGDFRAGVGDLGGVVADEAGAALAEGSRG